jgi:hypothetical protein
MFRPHCGTVIYFLLISFPLISASSDRLRHLIVILLGLKIFMGSANDVQALYDCSTPKSVRICGVMRLTGCCKAKLGSYSSDVLYIFCQEPLGTGS